jgi:hypothetical protein
MRHAHLFGSLLAALACNVIAGPPPGTGTEEFGLNPKQLVEAVEKTEGLIAACMRAQGFEYIAADFNTVRRGMAADKSLPGMSEKQFVAKHGFGLATLYTGEAPQLAKGYNPARIGLGEQNVRVYTRLAPADQVAYNRALLGEHGGATFAVALEAEDFSGTGGCTHQAVAQVFQPAQLRAGYYNPKDALINKDPRMKAALARYASEMRSQGFSYAHPDEVEPDIRRRLAAISANGTLTPEQMSPAQRTALKDLQDYERRAAAKNFELTERLIDPVADKIEEEMFSRKAQ